MLYMQTHLYKMMVINMSVYLETLDAFIIIIIYYLLFKKIEKFLGYLDYSFLFTCNVGKMKLKIYTFLQRNLLLFHNTN